MVFAENAGKLAEALVAHGERGLGDVGLAGSEQARGVIHAQTAQMGSGAVANCLAKTPAEMRGTLASGSSQLGQAYGVG